MKQLALRRFLWMLAAAIALPALGGCPNAAGPDNGGNNPPTASFVDYSVSGAGTTAVNGNYQQNGTSEGRLKYDQASGSYYLYFITASDVGPEDPYWVLHDSLGDQLLVVAYYNSDGTVFNAPESAWIVGNGAPNAPTVSRTAITGTLSVGNTLTGNYQYSDPDGDPEGSSTYQWYRFGNGTDTTGGTALGTALTHTVVAADSGNYLRLQVTPVDDQGLAGTPALSGAVAIP
jgi:hypothetical protein